MTILIAGGGIAGLTMALTCHQLGLQVKVFEAVEELRPLGVGINLQPNAVRELFALDLKNQLDDIGILAKEWALFAQGGKLVWSEPRGLDAGYNWPQYSVHRGQLQMVLLEAVEHRLGSEVIVVGAKLLDYESSDTTVTARFRSPDGDVFSETGSILIGADGIHSRVRAQMHPDQGAPHWGGAVMWRGVSQGLPCRTANSFVLVGSLAQRFVCYPISKPDPTTGLSTINWIAELTMDDHQSLKPSDWNRQAQIEDFIDEFEHWRFDWLNVPELIRAAQQVYEYPMVDRDPVDRWVDQRTVLIGDAAHVMYPVGSNGASQAIVDTRVLGAKLLEFGSNTAALQAYENDQLEPLNALVLRNRGAGPVSILGEIDDRSGGTFESIEQVMPKQEIEEFMAAYKTAAGFAVEELNAATSIIQV